MCCFAYSQVPWKLLKCKRNNVIIYLSSSTCSLQRKEEKNTCTPALPSKASENTVPHSLKDKLKVLPERGGVKRQVSQITSWMSKKVFIIIILFWRGDSFLPQVVLFQSSSPSSKANTCFLSFQGYCSPKTTFKADIQNYPKAPFTPSTA